MSGCSTVTDLGVVRDLLVTVDCNTRSFARLGYESLAASNSPFQTALTIGLTIYVALIGYRLLFGDGAKLSDGPLIALKIGAVLALVTSWSLFQTLVFDLAERAPLEIADVISAPLRGHSLAADPMGGLQAAYDQLSNAATAFAHPPKSLDEHAQGEFATAAHALGFAADGLLVASAGVIAVLLIAVGLLTAIGPLFIAMFLFSGTRGLFVGWVRALAASAFGLLSAWSLTILMLHAAEPWLNALEGVGANGAADAHTATTTAIIVLVFCAAQIGVMLEGAVIARGFRLSPRTPRTSSQSSQTLNATAQTMMPMDMISRPARLAEQLALQESTAVYSERAQGAAISVTYSRREGSAPVTSTTETRLGDSYRRPAVRREGQRA